ACGGGGGGGTTPAPVPAIQRLTAAPVAVGDGALITATFSGGAGRIEPDIGAVRSGVAVSTPPLAGPRRYTLVVEAAGHPSARGELEVVPAYRDRYVTVGTPQPLQYHAAVSAPDGSVIVIGGSRGMSALSEAVDRFDPATRTFTRIGAMATGRAQHSATRLGDMRALVLGGLTGLSSGGFAELVDLGTGAVEAAGRPVRPRIRHASVALDDGRVLVVGGLQSDSVELWDPATRSFRLVAARMHNVREFPTATRLADGRVLIVGGDHIGPSQRLAEIFDPRTERFEAVASPLDAERRAMHEAHALPDGRVLVLGGELSTGASLEPLDSVLLFDPATQTLSLHGRLDMPRSLVRSLLLPDDQVRLFGGQTGAAGAARSAGAYAPDRAARALAAMPAGRAWHTLSALADGRILILGGDDDAGGAVGNALLYE
ncbi:MAG: Kelch repeat-containing protein, partial [Roseateles sp.]